MTNKPVKYIQRPLFKLPQLDQQLDITHTNEDGISVTHHADGTITISTNQQTENEDPDNDK